MLASFCKRKLIRKYNFHLIISGERFDFVLNANQEAKSYWIRAKGWKYTLEICILNYFLLVILFFVGSIRLTFFFIKSHKFFCTAKTYILV